MVEPETWNLLFGGLTGRKCFIPEGCPPPILGVVVYSLLVAGVVAAAYYVYRNGVLGWKK